MRPPLEPAVSVFPTILFQGSLLLFLVLALLFEVTELALFALVLVAMGLVSKGWSKVSLKRVTCALDIKKGRLFPNTELQMHVRAKNSKLLPILFKFDLFVPGTITGSSRGEWITSEASLLSYQQAVFSTQLFPSRRGVFDLGPPMLRAGDLFGFHFETKRAREPCEIIVYPRLVEVRSISLPKREVQGRPGANNPIKDPALVFGTRDYQPGRPARGIHWKASLRHNRLQEKLCESCEEEKALFLLDVDGFEAEGAEQEFERCLEVVASLTLQMERRGIGVGFVTNGETAGQGSRSVGISKSPAQLSMIFEALARVGVVRSCGMADIVSTDLQVPRGASCLYFTHRISDVARAAGAVIRAKRAPLRFVVTHHSEASGDVESTVDVVHLDRLLHRAS